MKRIAVATIAATILALTGDHAFADDDGDAREASAIIASVTVCYTPISEDLKRILYMKMLKVMRTPSKIQFEIGQEIQAIKELSSSDQAAMCMAIADRVKSFMH